MPIFQPHTTVTYECDLCPRTGLLACEVVCHTPTSLPILPNQGDYCVPEPDGAPYVWCHRCLEQIKQLHRRGWLLDTDGLRIAPGDKVPHYPKLKTAHMLQIGVWAPSLACTPAPATLVDEQRRHRQAAPRWVSAWGIRKPSPDSLWGVAGTLGDYQYLLWLQVTQALNGGTLPVWREEEVSFTSERAFSREMWELAYPPVVVATEGMFTVSATAAVGTNLPEGTVFRNQPGRLYRVTGKVNQTTFVIDEVDEMLQARVEPRLRRIGESTFTAKPRGGAVASTPQVQALLTTKQRVERQRAHLQAKVTRATKGKGRAKSW